MQGKLRTGQGKSGITGEKRFTCRRRRKIQEDSCGEMPLVLQIEGLQLDDIRRMVTVDEGEVCLTPIEYKILRLLMREKGKVVSSNEIYKRVWNMRPVQVENTIAVHVRHIREKIEQDPAKPHYLKAVWGRGYMVG